MFALRLKELRKRDGYTQSTLAQKLKLSKGTIALWETGKRNPDFEMLESLSNLFTVSYDYLLGKTDESIQLVKTENTLHEIINWTVEDNVYDTIKMLLALDTYGQSAVDKLIKEEFIRCHDQKTFNDTSSFKISISMEHTSNG